MTERLNEELQFKPTAEWNLPRQPAEFLAWLRASGVPGDNDDERVRWFLENNRAAKFMPDDLKAVLLTG